METITTRRKRSVKLSPDEFTAFKKWVDGNDTKTDAYDALGIDKNTLDRVYLKGSGAPETIDKIKSTVPGLQAAA